MAALQNIITEDRLTFTFPAGTIAAKYDDWSYYRNRFNSAFGGTKAVDIIFVDTRCTWLIEIKDYRTNRRTKSTDFGQEIAFKVRDTLAGLASAAFNADDEEKGIAQKALSKKNIRFVLHLEQPLKTSRLFPKAIEPANMLLKLKQLLKAVDAHPVVVDRHTLKDYMSWTVTE